MGKPRKKQLSAEGNNTLTQHSEIKNTGEVAKLVKG